MPLYVWCLEQKQLSTVLHGYTIVKKFRMGRAKDTMRGIALICLALAISKVSCFAPFISKKKWGDATKSYNLRIYNETRKIPSKIPEHIRHARCNKFSDMMKSKKRWGGEFFGSMVRYFSNTLVGTIYTLIIKIFNRFTAVRKEILHSIVFNRENGRGLLTYSNHQSMADDPGLWIGLMPWWKMHPEQYRWAVCTEDVFFASPIMSAILGAGNVMPLDRSGSIDQPMLKRFLDKLIEGKWCHIYPEGRVWQNWRFQEDEQYLGDFKAGIGKVIVHSYPNDPIVLPIFHVGFDGVIPEKVLDTKTERSRPSSPLKPFPQGGNRLRAFVGNPLSFHNKIKSFVEQYPNELQSWETTNRKSRLYREITEELRYQMLLLEKEAYNRSILPKRQRSVWPTCEEIQLSIENG